MSLNQIKEFQSKISYHFKDESLLEEALTHPSVSKKGKNYQRLEFLGDTVLSLIIAELLIKKYPDAQEGDLSKRRAKLVSGETLFQIALEIELGEVIKFSKGEEGSGGKTNKNNLENALEALIGAIYLDSSFELGLKPCKEFILENWRTLIESSNQIPKDPVSSLQEMIQSRSKKLPTYQIEQIGGNSHQPIFEAIVRFDDKEFSAEGSSKKEAQKNVAKLAIVEVSKQ
ncbi:MAG: ribonuclease-3 [Lentimonas sp.]|jgi:ribonuclease-3